MASIKALAKGAVEGLFAALGFKAVIFRNDGKADFVAFDRNAISSFFRKDDVRALYEESLRASGMEWSDNFSKQCRFYSLYQLARHAVFSHPDLDAAECGCWRGHSTHFVSTLLRRGGFTGTFHVFDSFGGGLSDLSAHDKNERYEMTPEEVRAQKELFASTEEGVRRVLKTFPFTRLYKGWIPERFSEVADRQFAFVHIDVDLYEPIRDSLAFFFPRLADGGAIVLDDYGLAQFPGAKKAADEYLADKKVQFFFESPTGGAFLIK